MRADRITEIGAVRFAADGEVLETFESLVNPGRNEFPQTAAGLVWCR